MRLLKALRREPVDRTPVWFMRQAGRYMEEYRELRKKHDILEICRTPELAAEVTLQPLRRFPDLDAGIIFSDILMVAAALGMDVTFVKGEGPSLANPVRSESDVAALRPFESIPPVLEAIRIVKRESQVPLLGFAGAPFTLASYMIEGGPSKDYAHTRALMKTPAWPPLMDALSGAVAAHLRAQAEAGADALQLFDSWAGNLTPDEYREYVLPWSKRILNGLPVPVIHFATKTAQFLETFRDAGGDAVGVDWRIPLDEAWARIGDRAIQGNLDPQALRGPRGPLLEQVDDVLRRAGNRPGHVFNLGHGVLPDTPPDNVAAVLERVHERTKR